MARAKPKLTVDDIHSRIDVAMNALRELGDIHLRLGRVLGKELPVQEFKGMREDYYPTVEMTDEKFLRIVDVSIGKRDYMTRMQRLRLIRGRLVDDAMSALSKLEKLEERIKLQTEDSPERKVLLAKRPAVQNTVRILAYRIKICEERWAQSRRMLLNLISGETDRMFVITNKMSMVEALKKYPISEITSELLKMDVDEKKKGAKSDGN